MIRLSGNNSEMICLIKTDEGKNKNLNSIFIKKMNMY